MGSELSAGAGAARAAPTPPRTDLRERRAAPEGFDVGTAWSGGAGVGSGDDSVIASLCSAKLFPILKLAPELEVLRDSRGAHVPHDRRLTPSDAQRDAQSA